jgi:hypothetical protein
MCARLGRTRLFADLECAGRQDTVLWRVTGGGVERTPAALIVDQPLPWD